MTLGDIIQLVNLKLGEQSSFYPQSEIVLQGINPAQRLMCLAYPTLNYVRNKITVIADQPFIDLRTLLDAGSKPVGNRFRRVRRVSLGDVTDDVAIPTSTTGELRELRESAVKRLAARNNWLSQHGEVRQYWMWGIFWLGLYKRPIDRTTITIVYEAAPAPFTVDAITGIPTLPAALPDIPAVYHTVIADIATGLLLMKEGDPQATRGMARIRNSLNLAMQNPAGN